MIIIITSTDGHKRQTGQRVVFFRGLKCLFFVSSFYFSFNFEESPAKSMWPKESVSLLAMYIEKQQVMLKFRSFKRKQEQTLQPNCPLLCLSVSAFQFIVKSNTISFQEIVLDFTIHQSSFLTDDCCFTQANLKQHCWRTTDTIIEITGLKQRCSYR